MDKRDRTRVHFNKTPEEVIRDRRAQSPTDKLKAPRQPLGGAPPVKIPPLDADPLPGGGPMHEQASVLQDPTSPLSPVYNPQLALMKKQQQIQAQQDGPFAVLPHGAENDPNFVKGVGSMISGNQPQLRSGPRSGDPTAYKPVLSEKTRESMEALAAFQQQAERMQEQSIKPAQTAEEKEREDETANLGKVAAKTEQDMYEELRDIIGNSEQFNLLNNPKRRKEIEARLSKLDITDVLTYGEVRQDVTVRPDGKLVVSYRSVSAEEDLAVKQMMFGETGGDRYLMDKYTIMQLTLALVSINGEELPSHLDDRKKFNEEKFLKKFEAVVRFPIQFIADLGVQYLWFDERVRQLFVGSSEELKNI